MRVAVLFGGRSGEHDVSLVSARGVMAALDPDRFIVIPFPIGADGHWQHQRITPEPGANPGIDVVFPVLHGTFGEDGTMQGLLELADLPYVGAGVLASALCMDKAATKRMCAASGVPVVESVTGRSIAAPATLASQAEAAFGYPCFVKPANLGSSVGISKARDRAELLAAIDTAFGFDTSIIIERAVVGQELECAVLGNEEIAASVVGEIVPGKEFYDYEDKYLDGKAQTLIPARISDDDHATVRQLAVKTARALGVEGMARVDFFRETATGAIYLNEVNTIPGFTPISMYSKMWEASGLPYRDLLTKLVTLAIERHARRRSLRFSR
ncbi:MAG: D-alanine--D-alanine ligase [Bryobacterales bacterium]|nr:D-alanine--D-alanine ligase [Bryobacterales bacterium]